MGYFSNGTEGMDYERAWCSRCVHGPTEFFGDSGENSCAVWLAHLLYNGDVSPVLDLLIPRAEGGANGQCAMFRERDA